MQPQSHTLNIRLADISCLCVPATTHRNINPLPLEAIALAKKQGGCNAVKAPRTAPVSARISPVASNRPMPGMLITIRVDGKTGVALCDTCAATVHTYSMKIALFWVESAACPISGTVPQS